LFEQPQPRLSDLDQLEQLAPQFGSRERFITELTLDPPNATSDLSDEPHRDEDYLVLSTVHSAKGMEWDSVYVLNVVDGSFPNEFATGKQEAIDEERRLLYVAMTRARNDLQLLSPLKFPLTQQSPRGDAHVYGGRSRFITDKVLNCFDTDSYAGAQPAVEVSLEPVQSVRIDALAKMKQMW
jgi:DNA helicase-2/ATP-dependent DNA helicase PcrA